MKISRIKFVILFIVFGFAFLFITNTFLGSSGARVFPPTPNTESFLDTKSPTAWKSTTSKILLPAKIILIGPLLPIINFLGKEPDPPPPFLAIVFVIYWSILGSGIYCLLPDN